MVVEKGRGSSSNIIIIYYIVRVNLIGSSKVVRGEG